jgi:hypothetical protein
MKPKAWMKSWNSNSLKIASLPFTMLLPEKGQTSSLSGVTNYLKGLSYEIDLENVDEI